MLVHLSIRDIVLIDRLDIDFSRALSALTGETGAGKSIVLDAFSLALGARGDASLVREGAEQGQVTAAFDVPKDHPARRVLVSNALDGEGELILRRAQLADGRTRAFINDQPVSVQVLREVGRKLVEIHGQHDERALVDSSTHRLLLDAFAGHLDRVAEVGRLWDAWRGATVLVASERERLAKVFAEADYVRHALEELNALAPKPGEEKLLADRRALLMRAEKVAEDLKDAHETIAGGASPVPSLSALLRRLERRVADAADLVGQPVKALETALTALEEARDGIERALTAADFDPKELERIEERLFALRAAARKYGTTVDELPAVAARFASDAEAIDKGAERLASLQQAEKEAEAAYRAAADKLSAARKKAGTALDKAVNAELAAAEARSRRVSDRDREQPRIGGRRGARPGGILGAHQSGRQAGAVDEGGLRRRARALSPGAEGRARRPRLGADARFRRGRHGGRRRGVGRDRRAARASRRKVQVLAVTHAPQVAARAANHFMVEKTPVDKGKRVVTRVRALDAAARREEVARMLAGEVVTEEARAAAERLIAGAA